ncbi:hypothetical protein [Halorhabdus amylolytica]|uniref:hypothetical protein n=1 Tax=Halorhabdus amylolytica TaxID=2559573 RepID=UPI0010AB24DC|nr:hypothetical protein [Halorhabdus amylolytica]
MTPDLEHILGTDNRRFALPKSPFASVSLGITALRGLGAAGYIIGLLLFSFWVPGDSAELVIGSVSIDWTVVLGGGVLLCIIATILQMGILALSNRPSQPAPTLTLIVFELSSVVAAIKKLPLDTLDTNLIEPAVIVSTLLTIPVGIIYVGWFWEQLNVIGKRLGSSSSGRNGLPHIISVLPFVGLSYYFPRIGFGVFCGMFFGNLCVRGYRDLIVPLTLRRSEPDKEGAEISPTEYFAAELSKGLGSASASLFVVWVYTAAIFYDSRGASKTVAEHAGIETIVGYDPVLFLLGLGGIIVFLFIGWIRLGSGNH